MPNSLKVYNLRSFTDIAKYCDDSEIHLSDYVAECEGEEIWDYLNEIWDCMKHSVHEGLKAEVEIFGGLHVQRKAKQLYNNRHMNETAETKENRMVCAYAFAVSEQNAACAGEIVTALHLKNCTQQNFKTLQYLLSIE